jgi:hypothetical protein
MRREECLKRSPVATLASLSYFEEGADLLFALDSMNQSLVCPISTDKRPSRDRPIAGEKPT